MQPDRLATVERPSPAPPPRDAWAWLARLRWGACFGQAAAICGVRWWLDVPVPAGPLLVLVAASAASNLCLVLRLRRAPLPSARAMTALFVADLVVCSAALAASGGVHNPFVQVSLVHVALAATVLPAEGLGAVLAAAAACLLALFLAPLPDPLRYGLRSSPRYLGGMAAAYAVTAGFIALFVARTQQALARSQADLALARGRASRDERLGTLATLAAGAAHELAGPLGAIAVAAGEMERALSAEDRGPLPAVADALRDDVSLVRREVRRCREVLRQMAEDAEAAAGDAPTAVSAAQLVREAVDGLSGAARVRLHLAPGAPALWVPRRSVVHGLRAVVHNALQASAAAAGEGEVAVRVVQRGGHVHIVVADAGMGMSDAVRARAGEPFFTTKGEVGGTGLGLFLARTVFERLGGGLDVASHPGRGTTVELQLPLAAAGS